MTSADPGTSRTAASPRAGCLSAAPKAAARKADSSAASKTGPPVDMERLLDFANGDPVNLRELVELYLQQTSKQVEQLIAAVQVRNSADVKRLAHSCSGASSTCGMGGMVPLLRELERQGNEILLPNAPQLAADVSREFAAHPGFSHGLS